MAMSLYDPVDGYYSKGPRIGGEGGDFYTSAAFPAFARAIARLAESVGVALGEPARVLEFGPGTGAVARGLRDAGVEVVGLVETSPSITEARRNDGFRVAPDAAAFDPFRGLILANEVLDALPVHRLIRRATRMRELRIGLDEAGERFVEVEAEIIDDAVDRFAAHVVHEVPPGHVIEFNPGVDAILTQVDRCLDTGLAVFIDYGAAGAEHAMLRPHGTLRAYAEHRVLDYLDPEPGTADLTADVDFMHLSGIAGRHGFRTLGPVTQGSFLMDLGVAEELVAIAATDPVAALQAKNLFLPGGMGERFRVLGVARGYEEAVPGFRKPWEARA